MTTLPSHENALSACSEAGIGTQRPTGYHRMSALRPSVFPAKGSLTNHPRVAFC